MGGRLYHFSEMGRKLKKSLLKHLITSLLFLLNSFIVQGFTLRNCHISLNKAICTGSKLTEVPTDIPPTVESIDLSQNNIIKLQVANLTGFPNVTELILRQNQISHISKGTFSQLLSLTKLNLNNNKLKKLDNGVFDGLGKLTELLISYNLIKTVEPDVFRSLKNLGTLDFSNNNLNTTEQLGLIIKHTPRLKKLNIRHNLIRNVTSSNLMNASTGITYLDISLNPIRLFQITTNVFPNLTWLNVGTPPTTTTDMTWDVPDKTMLAKVTTLDVSGVKMASTAKLLNLLSTFNTSLVTLRINTLRCNLTQLINKSCSIPTLSQLQFGKQKNFFTVTSTFFTLCTNVTDINLSKNGIKRIANNSFMTASRLRFLDLSYNKLQTVPYAIRNLPLTKLSLNNNSIQTLGCHDFANMTNLRQLSLQWNKITALSECVFQNLPKLERLELQGNSLGDMKNAFHTSLPNLKTLLLNINSLQVIKSGEFRGCPSLENLTLSQNQISTFEKSSFAGLKNISNLQLQDNRIEIKTMDNIMEAFKDLVSLRSLNIGNNNIKYESVSPVEKPPFLYLSKLENLAFQTQRRRGKARLPSNFLQGLTSLSTISLRNIQLIEIPDELFIHTPKLDSLDLNSNDLIDISPALFSPIPDLTNLRISNTRLHSIDFLIDANLTKLNFLQARKNTFSVITEDIINSMPRLTYIDLEYNGFTCNCDNYAFIDLIRNNNQTQVFNAYNFTCYYPLHQKGNKLLDLNVQSCMIDIAFICFTSTSSFTCFFLLVSLSYHFMRFQLAYAYYIFLAWLSDKNNKKKNRRAPDQYDAFVSYNVHDEAWVYEELMPHLEREQGWKLCLHHRDFVPGKPIVENITDAIYGSRKTLCVISRRYLQSEWCSREMQVASFRLFDERRDVLILVFLEDIPSCHLSPYYRMRRVLKKQTYLRWPGPGAEAHVFWEKLRQALTVTWSAAEERLLLTVTDEQ